MAKPKERKVKKYKVKAIIFDYVYAENEQDALEKFNELLDIDEIPNNFDEIECEQVAMYSE